MHGKYLERRLCAALELSKWMVRVRLVLEERLSCYVQAPKLLKGLAGPRVELEWG